MTEITARLSTAIADRYRIERHLGEGMATVYLAHDLKHHRKVAVKVEAGLRSQSYRNARHARTNDGPM